MQVTNYLREKFAFIIMALFINIFISLMLKFLRISDYTIWFIFCLNLISNFSYYIYDFFTKKRYYDDIYGMLQKMDEKYLISEMIKSTPFLEAKILKDFLYITNKSMNDNISKFQRDIKDYEEYIELWVHEIKTPIAAIKIINENNESDIANSVDEEVEKVQMFIEQALFYTKSNFVENDYRIRKMSLRNSVNNVIKKNSNSLIGQRVKININIEDDNVLCDKKWIEFIINQIINNSIKYMDKENKILTIVTKKKGEETALIIEDNGIGMDEETINKAFVKGYTGENGRKFKKSTGVGLYLCHKLCNKLGISIKIQSKKNEYTMVYLIFPKNNMLFING